VNPVKLRNEIVESAFDIFISKRHEIVFFDGVEECIADLSKKYLLGILTNGNADIYKFDIGNILSFLSALLRPETASQTDLILIWP